MINKEEFENILKKYDLSKIGRTREIYTNKISPVLERKEIIILKGVRRCGKTTIMKQLIQELINKGVKKEDIIYVNLDDFNFLPNLSIDLLEFILNTRNLKRKQYLFFDEIQKISNFESWLRTHYDRETNVKFIISGSSSTLLAKDLATLLTGRNLTFEIYPLNYDEFKQFGSDSFDEYISFGGFPEVVLEKDLENKMNLLRNYVTDIISKDILMRREIKDQKQLLIFAQFILQNPGIRLSINKLSKQTSLSKDTVKKYLDCMTDAYLVFEVPFFSYSAKSKFISANVSKYYVLDNGFYIVNTPRKEKSKLFENIVALELHKKKDVFYWKGKNEVDFISGNTAFNVVSSSEIPEREKLGLEEFGRAFKNIKKIIINPSKNEKGDIEHVCIKDFLEKVKAF